MDSELAAWYATVQRFNPNHVAAGQAGGGQFAPASGSSSSSSKGAKGAKTKAKGRATPSNAHPVGMGETGQRVHDLQERLNALGMKPPLKVDGIFGKKTLAAVRQFQKAHGLKVDGLVGPKTTAALRTKTTHHKAKHKAAHHKASHHAAPAHKPAKAAAKPPAKAAPAGHPSAKRSDTWAADWARAWSR